MKRKTVPITHLMLGLYTDYKLVGYEFTGSGIYPTGAEIIKKTL